MKSLARLVAVARRCRHDGPMLPLRTLRFGVEIWRCELCRGEVVYAHAIEPERRP